MDRKMISAQIGEILDSLSRLHNNICAMDTMDIQRYPENYEVISTEAALWAEKRLFTCSGTLAKVPPLTGSMTITGLPCLTATS